MCYIYTSQREDLGYKESKKGVYAMVVGIIVAASIGLVLGVVLITAKFSNEMPINKTFDELWFEKNGESKTDSSGITAIAKKDAKYIKTSSFAKAA